MQTIQTTRLRLARSIAIVVSCVGLFSACGLGARNNYVPPSPPPASPIVASTHLVTFDELPVGATATAQHLTLTNTSRQTVLLQAVEISHPDSFARTTDCGHQLGAGQSCTTTVIFNPQSQGVLNARIDVCAIGFQSMSISLEGKATLTPVPPANMPPS